jgi:hypothetical protein
MSRAKKKVVSPQTAAWLDDTEVALSHRRVDKIQLNKIYVALDMEEARPRAMMS